MENVELARAIDEAQEIMDAVADISNRLNDPKSAFGKLQSAGVQIGFLRRDAISLEVHLANTLKYARQVLAVWTSKPEG